MSAFLTRLLLALHVRLKSRARLEAEIMVLRQQVIILSRRSRSRVRLRNIDGSSSFASTVCSPRFSTQ
jgi:hypothetical protein